MNFSVSFIKRSMIREWLIFLAFVIMTIAMTWPWVTHLRDAITDPGDPYINSWILWWDYHQTFHNPLNLFHANIFYPYHYTLAFSENNYGIALFFFPLFALGVRPLTIQGLATLLGFAFCGYGMFRLARTLTGSNGVAWIAGIVFAFIPYRYTQLPHLNYLSAGWIPIVLESLVLFTRERSRKYAVYLGLAFLMNGLSCIHWFVLTMIPLALSALILLQRSGAWRDRRLWSRGFLALGIAGLALVPFLVPYMRAAQLYGFVRNPQEIIPFSARPIDWLVGEHRNKMWGKLNDAFWRPEKALFPGFLPLLLALGAVFLVTPDSVDSDAATRLRLRKFIVALDALAIVCGILIVTISGYGFFKARVFGHYLFEIRNVSAVFVVLMLSLLVRLLIAYPAVLRRARESNVIASLRSTRRSEAFWLGVVWSAIGFLGSLGLNFYFHQFLYDYVPLFRSIRVPARWGMIAYVGLALLAGLGAKQLSVLLVRHWPRMRPAAVFAIIALAVLIEQRAAPLDLLKGAVDPDPLTLWLKQTPMAGGIVELPSVIGRDEIYLYTLRAADHGKPLVTAVSGFSPPLQIEIQALTNSDTVPARFMELLESIPCSYLVIHNNFLDPGNQLGLQTFLGQAMAAGRLRFIDSFESADLYAVTRVEPNSKSKGKPSFAIGGNPMAQVVTPTISEGQPNQIDDARFFVRTQYLDVLEREPEPGGWDYWTKQIESCGNDVTCKSQQRAVVATAFLSEKEYEDTALFLYGLYQATLGRPPSYAEFKADRAKLIGGPGLETSKNVFLEAWTNRPEFLKRYPLTSAPEEFIDRLLQTANASAAEDLRQRRADLLSHLKASGRTTAIRLLSQDENLRGKQRDPGLLTTEYFSFLKRGPQPSEIKFWTDVLSKGKRGDSESIVKSLITSNEYRARFLSP